MGTIQPLTATPPKEVPLPRAPLVKVIAQIRFPTILTILHPDKVAAFQEELRDVYPNLNKEQAYQVDLDADQAPQISGDLIWRLSERGQSPSWRVSLSTGFVALETTAYKNRTDFHKRLKRVVSSLEETFHPAEVNRLGIRYIDQLKGDAVNRIHDLIKPEVLGILKPTLTSPMAISQATENVFTQAIFQAQEGFITGRWGNIAPNTTYAPNLLDPIQEPSWVLDLDMFTQETQPFKCAKLINVGKSFSDRIYSIFREMITDEFLEFYGGEL